MRYIIVMLLFSVLANAQTKGGEFYSEDFNWSIVLPEGFKRLTDDELKGLENDGVDVIEKAYDTNLDGALIPNKTLFGIESGPNDFLEANMQAFDTAADGDYEESVKAVWEIIYQTFKSELPSDTKIIKKHSTEKISNLKFYKSTMVIKFSNGIIMNSIMYSRLFGNKDFTLNILYTDSKTGDVFMKAWKSSVFK
jgi:hypothetical protein